MTESLTYELGWPSAFDKVKMPLEMHGASSVTTGISSDSRAGVVASCWLPLPKTC
jgi:hypothetical protein